MMLCGFAAVAFRFVPFFFLFPFYLTYLGYSVWHELKTPNNFAVVVYNGKLLVFPAVLLLLPSAMFSRFHALKRIFFSILEIFFFFTHSSKYTIITPSNAPPKRIDIALRFTPWLVDSSQ
jgi:hypothetical protein